MKRRNLKELLINLLKNKHLLSVSEVLVQLENDSKTFNKTSVYRAIDQLLADDVICQHFFSGTEAYYELREHHHDHLVCNNCRSIETADCDYKQPEKIGDFLTNHHHITVFGLCKNCQTS
jgi:Fur family ferric uptake transcriptional regulator